MSPYARLVALAALLALAASYAPQALRASGLATFSNGAVADAAAVNGNFTNLDERLAALESTNLGARVTALETRTRGDVVSMAMAQTRAQSSWTVPPSGNGTVVTPMTLTLTPKKAGNRVVLQWVLHGETNENVVYLVSRNGTLLGDATNASNNRWAAVVSEPYDNNHDSTPDNIVVKIVDTNSLAVASNYELLVRSSNGSTHTFQLNRSYSSAGQDSYEAGLSVGTATEVWW